MDNHLTECLPNILRHLRNNFYYTSSTQMEQQIFSTVISSLKCFELYKDLQVHSKVKQVCPWEQLSLESSKKMANIKRNSIEGTILIDSRDLFLIELLDWFKKEFFTWFQEPTCKKCLSNTGENKPTQMKMIRYDDSNTEEKKWRASTVEIYSCPNCKDEFRFPRYNHPLKLLETRTGNFVENFITF